MKCQIPEIYMTSAELAKSAIKIKGNHNVGGVVSEMKDIDKSNISRQI